jgi:membrane protease YdiL (CAAX protease family)
VTTPDYWRHHVPMEGSREPNLLSVVVTTFAGVIVGATAAGYLLVKLWSYDGPDQSIPLILTLYVIDAAIVVVVALLALYWRYRAVSDVRTGVIWVGLGLVAGGLLSMAPAIAFAAASGYSTEGSVPGAEVVIVAACCVVGITAGGQAWLSTRRLQA